MAKHKFSVTYEIWDEDDTEAGETDRKGFVTKCGEYLAVEDITPDNEADIELTFSEALECCGGLHAVYSPCGGGYCNGAWDYTHTEWYTKESVGYNGETEQRSLHLPPHLKPETRKRIAKILGCK